MRAYLRFIFMTCVVFLMAPKIAFARNIVQEMIDGVNTIRYQNGFGQLYTSDALMRAAFYHAQDMANRNYFSHYTPEGWSPQMRAVGQGYPDWLPIRENLGVISYEPWQVIQMWMNEGSHREVILNGSANDIGVANYYNPNSAHGNYWVLVVGGRR